MALERGLRTKEAQEWLVLLRQQGIACAPVNGFSDVFHSPQVQFRKMGLTSKDGRFVIAGNPLKISGYDDLETRHNPPMLNAHRESILAYAAEAEGKNGKNGKDGGREGGRRRNRRTSKL